MSASLIDPFLVFGLLINFYVLGMPRLRLLIVAVAIQGVMLGLLYPLVHEDLLTLSPLSLLRLLLLTVAIIGLKGWLIPKFLFKAVLLADMRSTVTSVIGFVPTLVLGGAATTFALVFAGSLPLPNDHQSHLLIPASLATVMRKAVIQARLVRKAWRVLLLGGNEIFGRRTAADF